MDQEQGKNQVDVRAETIERGYAAIAEQHGLNLASGDTTERPAGGPNPVAPPQQQVAAPLPDLQQQERVGKSLGGILTYGFTFGFGWLLTGWKVTSEECMELGQSWGKVLAKWIPLHYLGWVPGGGGSDGSVCLECDALRVTFEVVAPRVQGEQSAEPIKPQFQTQGDKQQPAPAEPEQPETITAEDLEADSGLPQSEKEFREAFRT